MENDEIKKYSSMAVSKDLNPVELPFYKMLEELFTQNEENVVSKLKNFSLYVPRQDLTRFLVRYELFKKNLNVVGSIVECGVLHGQGLMTFAHLSSIFENLNLSRKIIGFDTFEGFPSEGSKYDNKDFAIKGDLNIHGYENLKKAIECFDFNRLFKNFEKVELVKGDMCKTVPQYLKENPHTIVSMLYIDCDYFEPTKVALENFVPRMPKGGMLVFDEINHKGWQGETIALLQTLGISKLRLERFPFDTKVSYAVLE